MLENCGKITVFGLQELIFHCNEDPYEKVTVVQSDTKHVLR